jgi:hypothetical protein
MRSGLIRLLVFIVASACIANAWAQDNRRDGNWWGAQTRAWKISYAVGFFDGMDLGASFSQWGLLNHGSPNAKTDIKSLTASVQSFQKYSSKYFDGVTASQLSDGLDSFYADYRNRGIAIHDSVWMVVQTIAGEPPSEDSLNNWRKKSKP